MARSTLPDRLDGRSVSHGSGSAVRASAYPSAGQVHVATLPHPLSSSPSSSIETRLATLMRAVQRDAPRATELLMQEAAGWLHGYLRHRLPPECREDVVQETLAALFARRGDWDSERPFLPWLAGIARHRWLDHLRRAYAQRTRDHSKFEFDRIAAETAGDNETGMLAQACIEQLFAAIPTRQASAIRLVKLKGYSVREAASLTGQSESLIKVQIHRGMRKLALLARQHSEEAALNPS